MHSYTYVIAVDFEATCWEKQPPPQWRDAEIIEFPAILVNLRTGKVESQFHKYVKPVELPQLSKYCTNLTGIQQKTVDAGVPVQTALDLFIEWLKRELKERDLTLPKMSEAEPLGNCLLSSWTDWDFGICLAKECVRKDMRKPGCFDQWMDARAIFRQFYNYRPYNFSNALAYLKLNFQGRAHSGIDDAKNLATLLCKMYRTELRWRSPRT
ncbi:ERI1 exoribonuclease 2-like [Drosophila obscura]|uniref:ERI1 exoribonuclease 2-like n=1 Tax=Drosophila obscura TaxID=7282 RepID=UPI001BB293EC|nr:ERI1 exoribonuclease 2-like [Drosophila obscura]